MFMLCLLVGMTGSGRAQVNGLTSYVRNYAGDWWPDDVIQLSTGDNFALGPQGPNGDMGGQWTWTGPNNFQSNNREVAFNNVTVDQAGIYTVTLTANNGAVYTHEVKVYVDSKLSKNDVLRTYAANDKADQMYEDFNKAFLYTNPNSHRTYYKYGYNNNGNLYSWEQGLNLLMLMDRYRFRGDETMIPIISKTVDALNGNENGNGPSGRNVENGNGIVPKAVNDKYSERAKAEKLSNWTWNEYNDDLLWLSLPNMRAYQITGEKRFLNQAKWTWDYMDERGWDDEMGGGYWWCVFLKSEKDQCKSGLSNNPAICLSAYLYEATGDVKYLNRAKEIFEWVCAVLRNADGSVDEGIRAGQRLNGYNVYNQGPFIEGGAALYRITGDERYFNIAKQTMDWTIQNKVNNNGIMEHGSKTDGTWQSEFMRGMAFLLETRPELWRATTSTKGHNQITYYDWLRMNADAAYNTRETAHGLSDCAWDKATTFLPDNTHSEMWVGSVIAEQVAPTVNPWQGNSFMGYGIGEATIVKPVITPYIYAADGWQQVKEADVQSGKSFMVGPQANGNPDAAGTWLWTGPNNFTSNNREFTIDNVSLANAGTYTVTFTDQFGQSVQENFVIKVDGQSEIAQQPAEEEADDALTEGITSYIMNYAGIWCVDDVIQLSTGDSFSVGPQGLNGDMGGQWTWTGPNNFQSNNREIAFNNVTIDQAGIYTVRQVAADGKTYKHDVKVYVDSKLSKNDVLRTYAKNDKADQMYEDFNKAFLYTDNNKRVYYKEGYNSNYKLYSWEQGLNLLMLMDRYRFRGDETMIPIISKTVDALNANENGNNPSGRNVENGNGIVPRDINNKYSDRAKAEKLSNWTWNEYNDDLLWLSLPNMRAYQITGEKRFLEQTKWTWDYMDERGWDGEMGGGYWWCVFPRKEKDQCKSGLSNNPAIGLSAYLYEATGDEKYLNRAKAIFEWVYAVLRDKDGKISENINIVNSDVPTKSGGYNVYNQGPFIEGAAALYRITGDERYFNAAKETMDWTIQNRVNNDGIMEYGNKTDGTWQSEFMRGMAFLMETRPELWRTTTSTKGHNQITYYDWLRMNADAAYNTRETAHGLSDCAWDKATTFLPDNKHSEMWVGSVIAVQVVPETNPWQGNNFNGYKVDIPTPETLAEATGYVQDQYGWWKATRLGVDPGESVALRAETALNGTWSWIGPKGALSSTTNEVSFNNFTADMSGAYIATCTANNGTRAQVTFYVNVLTTQKATIVPYVVANNGWQQTNTLNLEVGNNFSMGPQVKDTPNADVVTWSWAGPDNFTSQNREVTLNNVSTAKAGIYTATITDMFGQHVQENFSILIGGASGQEDITTPEESTAISTVEAVNAPTEVFDLQGRKVTTGRAKAGIYVVNGKKVIRK